MRRQSRRVGVIGMIFLVFALCTAGSLALPQSDYIRFQSFQGTIFARLKWVYERIHFDPTPIDVLLMGSSRMARGVDATALEQALAERGLEGLNVANLSLPASGLDLRYEEIREALSVHDATLVVFSLVEQLPRDGHQAFGDLASVGSLLSSPAVVNRNLPENLAALPYRQIELAVASLIPEAFGYSATFDPAAYRGTSPDLRLFNEPDRDAEAEALLVQTPAHAEALATESRRRHRQIRRPILPDGLAWAEFGVSRTYIDRVAALTEARGAELAFLFQPFYQGYDAPLDRAYVEQYGPLWIADFLAQDPTNYLDAAHMSQAGADKLVPWLADRIVELIGEDGT